MSRQKRGVQYMQQEEPAFLKRMKQQAGFKEGPTIDTKRQEMDERESGSDSDIDDEKPQVVVLKSGDLTEDQAKIFEKEAETKPREATDEKIVFKKPKKAEAESADTTKDKSSDNKKFKSKSVKNSSLLSFNDQEEDE